jgi:hypothetical protein
MGEGLTPSIKRRNCDLKGGLMLKKILILAVMMSAVPAFADEVAINCNASIQKLGSRDPVTFTSIGVAPRTTKFVSLTYRRKELSDQATINTIQNNGNVVRYIVKDDDLTFTFSHLEKCGDSMEVESDYARVTVTRTDGSGDKETVEQLFCACDID